MYIERVPRPGFNCFFFFFLLVEDEGKGEDAQSAVSGGEEYEPISDDELDEILADSQKRDDQQDEEKVPGTETECASSEVNVAE